MDIYPEPVDGERAVTKEDAVKFHFKVWLGFRSKEEHSAENDEEERVDFLILFIKHFELRVVRE